MAFGKIKADAIIRDNGGSEEEVTMASLVAKAGTASPTFTGTVTLPATVALAGQASDITIPDDQAAALEIKQGDNAYMTFVTTNSGEKVQCNQTFDVTLAEIESQRSTLTSLSGATPTADISTASTFVLSVAGNVTISFSNPPANNVVTAFLIQVNYSSGTLTWPNTVEWIEDGTAPTMTASRTTTFLFYTPNGGTNYFGSYLLDYNI